MSNSRTVTATVYDSFQRVRVSVPADLAEATCGDEISTGIKLCGYHRGRRWGVVYTYSIWTGPDGCANGDIWTAYDLTNEADAAAYEEIVDENDAACYEY